MIVQMGQIDIFGGVIFTTGECRNGRANIDLCRTFQCGLQCFAKIQATV